MKSEFITIKNIKTHVQIFGNGNRIIVFLHGWGGSIESFSSLAAKVAKKFNLQCVVVDLPGFGESDMPPIEGWAIANYEQWFSEFLEKKKIINPLFYGHSFGCRIILDYVLKHPDYREKIILTGAAGIKWPPSIRENTSKYLSKKLSFLKPLIPQKIYKILLRKVFKAHDWADLSENLKATFKKTIQEPDLSHRLPEIQSKVLLLWGRHDSYTPLKSGLVFHEKLPHSTLKIFDTGRHGIHYTHEEYILKELETFL